MSNMIPVAVYGLTVPAGDVMIPAIVDFPATFRITMAAIDPSATPEHTGTANGNTPPRATLKLVYDPRGPGDDDDSEEDSEDEDDVLKALLEGRDSQDEDDDEEEDEESSSDDEEKNGGPSDPSKTKKARREAAVQQLMKTLAESNDDSKDDVDMDDAPKANGVGKALSKATKGKGKALAEDSGDDESEDTSEISLDGLDEQVVCTLDPEKNYQQPLDITIPEDQRAYFKVSGTHAIYLTGNYVVPADSGHHHQHEDDSEDYDMSPDEDELELLDEDESDELDDMEDPRITEVVSEDEEEPPKLIKKEEPTKKGKNKRVHEESSDVETPTANLDDIMAKSLKPEEPSPNGNTGGEPKLSKKQLKKLKNNAGKAVEAAAETKDVKKDDNTSKESDSQKGDKKVQFAKNLEQGPSASPSTVKADIGDKGNTETKKDDAKPKASLGVRTVAGGVKIDDKKLGKGPAAKKGSRVGMRYIGKLKDGKVFDANKSGKPFSFTLGEGSVIKGWDIGVAGMSVGGERRIIVPAEMGYGKKGAPPDIPPNSELTFDLKMLEVK